MKLFSLLLVLGLLLVPVVPVRANSLARATPEERVQSATAICQARVLGAASFLDPKDGGIHTRTWLQVTAALKGRFPATISVVHRGGVVGELGQVSSAAPNLRRGDERIFLLGQRTDGTLFVDNGSSGALLLDRAGVTNPYTLAVRAAARRLYPDAAGPDLTASAAIYRETAATSGLLLDGRPVSRRFTAGDRGEPIGYLVDADALPAGLTQAQALGAVSNAFRAWATVTGLKFAFQGVTSFGAAANTFSSNDGLIRVQLHDLYGSITDSSVLGVGGNDFTVSGTFPNGGMGGNVNGNEFYPVLRGHLVMKHTQSALQTLSTFEEVACHEIGHILSMAHSSETLNEPDPVLAEATMYFTAHEDGRGARLGAYDPPVIQQVYPATNTPPWSYGRIMDIVTASPLPNIAGINEVEIRGYDLQKDALTVSLASSTANYGTFSLTGNILRFTPGGLYGDSPRVDPATSSSYDRALLRISDGTNGSPYVEVRVLSFKSDLFSDGVPDSWMTKYFGDADPSVGLRHQATDDADGDGVSNFNEYRSGTDPTSAASVLRFTSITPTALNWLANPYDLYEVQATSDFKTWVRAANPVTPTTTNGSLTNLPAVTNRLFFRIQRVP